MARDQVRLDAVPQDAEGRVERVLPQRLAPLDERIPAPHVVDQDVEPCVVAADASYERADVVRVGVVAANGDPFAAGGRDELGSVLDCLRAVHR